MLGGREEAEIYIDGSICHRGCSGHQSCHCWLNKSGKMIALQVHNHPKNDAELTFFFACVIVEWLSWCLCVRACGKGVDDIYVIRIGSESPRRGENAKWEKDKKYISREAGFNPCSFACRRDWWLHSGFLHPTNWIHRSLDKVHDWDRYGLKTEEGKWESGKKEKGARGAILMRLFGSGPIKFLPLSAVSPKPCSTTQRWGGVIDNLCSKKRWWWWRGLETEGGRLERRWEIKRMSWCYTTHVACCLFLSIYRGRERKWD